MSKQRSEPARLVIVLCFAAGCYAQPAASQPARSHAPVPADGVIRQAASNDCGLAVLATMLTELGTPTSLGDLGSGVRVREQGLSMQELQRLASLHAVDLAGMRDGAKRVDRWPFPWIAHMSDGAWQHYVLVEGAGDGVVRLADPASGRIVIGVREFTERWSGRALVMTRAGVRSARFSGKE